MPGSPELTSLWRPLRVSSFRNLIIADVVSDVGAFMQSTGAAWLMVSLNAGPMYVALTQTASALPFFLFALPAGAIGDIVDRRKLILYTETWMAGVALVLAVLTIGGLVGPLLLLILTFALSAGDAFETPVELIVFLHAGFASRRCRDTSAKFLKVHSNSVEYDAA